MPEPLPDNQKSGGLVYDIQRFSLHDGPGIRTIVFMKGCPLKCLWCSNPESQKPHREILFNALKCIDCGTCRDVCPQNAIRDDKDGYRIDSDVCDACGKCCDACPTQALRWSGTLMSVAEVLAEIEKDRAFYDTSGGGVTFSGGEPLGQFQFLKGLLAACRSAGIHTAVETCGFCSRDTMEGIVPFTDIFLFDLKHTDPLEHKKLTGRDNRQILENLENLCRKGAAVILRMPVVPGLNDSDANLNETAALMKRLKIDEIHLLPYHNCGENKYRMLGCGYALKDLPVPSEKDIEPLKSWFETQGLKVTIGGE